MSETRVFFRGDLDVWHIMGEYGFGIKERVMVEVLLANAWARMEERTRSMVEYAGIEYIEEEGDASFEITAEGELEDVVASMAKWVSVAGIDGVPGPLLDNASETITVMAVSGMWMLATCGLRILRESDVEDVELDEFQDDLLSLDGAMWLLEVAYDEGEGIQLTTEQLLEAAARQGRDEMAEEHATRPYQVMLNGETRVAGMFHSGEHVDNLRLVLMGDAAEAVLSFEDVVGQILDGDLEVRANTDIERGWRMIGMLEALSAFGVAGGKGDAVNVEMRRLGLLAVLPEKIVAEILGREEL